eukprot:scaffold99821_cov61-Phaeocystis_antarctica.AAC.1
MDPLTPDAGMTEVYAEQSSLGKRDRNDESPEEKSSAAAPGAPEICDNKKAALESATDPKHLGKLTERVPVLLTEAGEPNKSMEIIGASAVQSDGAAAGAAALLGGSTENENAEMIVEMRTEGYTEDEITDLIKQSESAPKQVGPPRPRAAGVVQHRHLRSRPEGGCGQGPARDCQGGEPGDLHQRERRLDPDSLPALRHQRQQGDRALRRVREPEALRLLQGHRIHFPRPQFQGHRPQGVVRDGELGQAHRQDLRAQHRRAPVRAQRRLHPADRADAAQ